MTPSNEADPRQPIRPRLVTRIAVRQLLRFCFFRLTSSLKRSASAG